MLEFLLQESFLRNAMTGGVGIALLAGPLGCFILWRRMAYVGDAFGHIALLGVSLGVVGGFYPLLGAALVLLAAAFLLSRLGQNSTHAVDAALGIMAQGGLSLGLVLLSLGAVIGVDINAYLFGDILAIDERDHLQIYGLLIIAILLLVKFRRGLMLMTVSEDIARVEGVRIELMRLLLMGLIALTVAVSIPLVGVLLIAALLIIPASAARLISRSPLQMILTAALIAVFSVIAGLKGSVSWDTPSGPSIVVACLVVYLTLFAAKTFVRK